MFLISFLGLLGFLYDLVVVHEWVLPFLAPHRAPWLFVGWNDYEMGKGGRERAREHCEVLALLFA